MAEHATAGDLAFEHAQGREQAGALTLVIVREDHAISPLRRQTWLRAVERLDLALLGMERRVYVEADDIVDVAAKSGSVSA